MPDSEDRDLKGVFRDLREEEKGRVPPFHTLWARAREEAATFSPDASARSSIRRPIPRRLAWAGSLLAAAAAATVLFIQLPGTSESEFVQVVQDYSSHPAAGAWKSPTDGLLDVPGSEILSTVPSIGMRRWLSESGAPPQRNDL